MFEIQNNLKVKNLLFASGTLSPIDSFASSLQLSKPHLVLENAHVVSSDNVCISIIGKGATNGSLNGSFENRTSVRYVDELGTSLVALVNSIPDGVLVFFSSYTTLEMFHNVWLNDGTLKRITENKKLFVETKGSSASDQKVLMGEYDKQIQANNNGAVLFSVCRGKSSEGMDFTDAKGE